MLELVVEFLLLILEVVIEVVLGMTGYAVLFVFSLGRIRPKLKDDWLATIVGLLFWVIVIGALCLWNRA